MKNRLAFSLIITLVLLLIVSGCSPGSARDLMVHVRAAERPANPVEPAGAFADSFRAFSWSLFREIAQQKGNVLVSPASVYLVLGMTANGSAGTTRDAFARTLAAENLTLDQINSACRDWMTLLTNAAGKADLLISNSIWYNAGFSANPAFLQVNAGYYAASLRQMDFGKAEAAQVINDWVSQATKGKIKSIMDKAHADDAMYLINAVYFKSQWKNQFASMETQEGDFHLEKGTTTVRYMNRQSEMNYISGDGMRGVLLPFVDERFAFIAVLPPEGCTIQDAVNSMDPADLKALLASGQEADLSLYLPKFETEYEIGLLEILSRLGLQEACQAGADFSLMSKNHDNDLRITGIGHKTYFKIDEAGAEAAAVTGLTMAASIQPDESKLVFDRPFLYGIIDTAAGLPLFLGIMADPAG